MRRLATLVLYVLVVGAADDRDSPQVAALRAAIAAIDNAEAPPARDTATSSSARRRSSRAAEVSSRS